MKTIFQEWVFKDPNSDLYVIVEAYTEPFENKWNKGIDFSWQENWSDGEIRPIESIGLFGEQAVIRFVEQKFSDWEIPWKKSF